ncbi:MAG TPA: hypothetical protein VEP66_14990, partial [Myxococcales bacterium]|nr:hypothetical protein [Myxococcales bacterium]
AGLSNPGLWQGISSPRNMLGLTTLGTFHTAAGLVAMAAGFVALVRDKEISSGNRIGKLYVILTLLTVGTAFGMFPHGFGKPHALGILTLVVLLIALAAEYGCVFGRFSRPVGTVSYSATFLFHWIPAIAEMTTRLPSGAPLFHDPEAPGLQMMFAVLIVLFLVGARLQTRRLSAEQRGPPALRTAPEGRCKSAQNLNVQVNPGMEE